VHVVLHIKLCNTWQLHYEETIDQLRQSLSHSEDTITVQQQRIEQMEKDLPESPSKPRTIRSPRTRKPANTPGAVYHIVNTL